MVTVFFDGMVERYQSVTFTLAMMSLLTKPEDFLLEMAGNVKSSCEHCAHYEISFPAKPDEAAMRNYTAQQHKDLRNAMSRGLLLDSKFTPHDIRNIETHSLGYESLSHYNTVEAYSIKNI